MKRAYVVRWRTSVMPAPAFWYFATGLEAEYARVAFTANRSGTTATVEPVDVPDDFDLIEADIHAS
jgi:hypothetical protein